MNEILLNKLYFSSKILTMQNSTKVSLLSNNKFLIKNSEFIAWVYNTWEVWNNAIFEYKKSWKNLMIRCLEREKWKDLEWDEIPEDTWIEKYNIFIIKEWKLDKDVIKEYSLEYIEKELEEFCEWQDFNIKKIWKYFHLHDEEFEDLKKFIIEN